MELIDQIRVGNRLGECVLWDEHTGHIWWTDIENKILYSRKFSGGKIITYPVPERLCAFGFMKNRSSLICAFESGFALFSPKTGAVNWLKKTRTSHQNIRLNDGRVDPRGRFWVGEMSEDFANDPVPQTRLFCLEGRGKLTVHEQGMQISNGLCWSPDGKKMYFADSPKNEMYQYDLDLQSGYYTNKQVFARTAKDVHPDGSCVDAQGFVWNAQWGAGKVVRYAPSGTIDTQVDIPCLQPTCAAFGGPNLDHLIVTTASLPQGRAPEKTSDGDVFIFKTPYKGRLENRFVL